MLWLSTLNTISAFAGISLWPTACVPRRHSGSKLGPLRKMHECLFWRTGTTALLAALLGQIGDGQLSEACPTMFLRSSMIAACSFLFLPAQRRSVDRVPVLFVALRLATTAACQAGPD